MKDVTDGGFLITRDESGNPKPVEGVTPQLGMPIKVIPLMYGQTHEYPAFVEGIFNWPLSDQARVIREQVVECNGITFDDLDEASLNGMEAWAVQDMLQAIALYSGFSHLFVAEAKKAGMLEDMET